MTAATRIPLERDVKRAVIATYRRFGARVWNLDQGFRPGGRHHGTTRQTKGLADLYITLPGRGAWWHELKRPGGAQRPEQQVFEREVVRCGTAYALGGVGAAFLALRDVAGLQLRVDAIHLTDGDRLALPDRNDEMPPRKLVEQLPRAAAALREPVAAPRAGVPVEVLIRQWRDRVRGLFGTERQELPGSIHGPIGGTYATCAQELEAALVAAQPGGD